MTPTPPPAPAEEALRAAVAKAWRTILDNIVVSGTEIEVRVDAEEIILTALRPPAHGEHQGKRELAVFKLCHKCNREFEIEGGHNNSGFMSNMQNCPHCGIRNDTWIHIPVDAERHRKNTINHDGSTPAQGKREATGTATPRTDAASQRGMMALQIESRTLERELSAQSARLAEVERERDDVAVMHLNVARLLGLHFIGKGHLEINKTIEVQIATLQSRALSAEQQRDVFRDNATKAIEVICELEKSVKRHFEDATEQSRLHEQADALYVEAAGKVQRLERQVSDLKEENTTLLKERGAAEQKVKEVEGEWHRAMQWKDEAIREAGVVKTALQVANDRLGLNAITHRYDKEELEAKLSAANTMIANERGQYETQLSALRAQLQQAQEELKACHAGIAKVNTALGAKAPTDRSGESIFVAAVAELDRLTTILAALPEVIEALEAGRSSAKWSKMIGAEAACINAIEKLQSLTAPTNSP